MKLSSIFVCLLAAALSLPAAGLGEILTTWEFPDNLAALEEEYESNTNVVTPLVFNHSARSGTATVICRDSGGRLSAAGFGGDGFFLRVAPVKSAASAPRAASGAVLEASDATANYDTSAPGATWLGGTGGEGWDSPWKILDETGDRALVSFFEGDMSLETATGTAGVGEVAVGRDLAAPLRSGELAIHSWLDASPDFRGFAVYDADGEIFRFGTGCDASGTVGWVYSVRNGENILFFEGSIDSGADYALSWQPLESGLRFAWSESTGYWAAEHAVPLSIDVSGALPVQTVALIAAGDPRLTFSSIAVSGTPATAVPEPATLSLLLAGAVLLAARRRREPPGA